MGLGALRRHSRWAPDPIPQPEPGLISREEHLRVLAELEEKHAAEVQALQQTIDVLRDELDLLTPDEDEGQDADEDDEGSETPTTPPPLPEPPPPAPGVEPEVIEPVPVDPPPPPPEPPAAKKRRW